MKRSRISQKLAGVRKVLKSNDTAVVGLGEETKIHDVESSRIMSHEAAHYILVKGVDIESQSSQDEDEADTCSQTSSMETHQNAAGRDCQVDNALQDERYWTERVVGRDNMSASRSTTVVEKLPTAASIEPNVEELGLESSGKGNDKSRPKGGSNDGMVFVINETEQQRARDDTAEVQLSRDKGTRTHIIDLTGKADDDTASSFAMFSKDTLASQQVSTDEATTTTRVVCTQGPLSIRTAKAVLMQEPLSAEVARSESSISPDTESKQQHPVGSMMSFAQTTNSESSLVEEDVNQNVTRNELLHSDATSEEGNESTVTVTVDLTANPSHSAQKLPVLSPPAHSVGDHY